MEILVVIILAILLIMGFALLSSIGSLLQLAVALIIWMITGTIAGQLIRGRDYGILGNVALGLAGGIVGTFVLRVVGFSNLATIPFIGAIIAGVLGAVLFVLLMRLLVDANFGA